MESTGVEIQKEAAAAWVQKSAKLLKNVNNCKELNVMSRNNS